MRICSTFLTTKYFQILLYNRMCKLKQHVSLCSVRNIHQIILVSILHFFITISHLIKSIMNERKLVLHHTLLVAISFVINTVILTFDSNCLTMEFKSKVIQFLTLFPVTPQRSLIWFNLVELILRSKSNKLKPSKNLNLINFYPFDFCLCMSTLPNSSLFI